MPTHANRTPRRAVGLAATSIAALAAVAAMHGCVFSMLSPLYEQVTSFNIPHVPDSRLEVQTKNGAITVRESSGSEVEIQARLSMASPERLEQTTISAVRTPEGILRIEAIPPGQQWQSREGCSFEIQIPAIARGTALQSSNGRIELRGLSGSASLSTTNGSIRVEGHDGEVRASTSNGAVVVNDAAGPIHIRTTNGSVTARIAPQNLSPVDIRTTNGSVSLEVPPGYAGKLSLRTTNGAMRVAGELAATVNRSSKRTATVTLGGEGGANSEIRTTNGAISIRLAAPRPISSR